MADLREQILARLRVLIGTVQGLALNADQTVRGVGRNRDDVSGKARPAIIMHDGAEESLEFDNPPPRSGVQLVKMTPQFVILTGNPTEQVGTVANGFRERLLATVFADQTLAALIGQGGPRGAGGQITYDGCVLETEAGQTREARMTVDISLTYVFRTSDLSA